MLTTICDSRHSAESRQNKVMRAIILTEYEREGAQLAKEAAQCAILIIPRSRTHTRTCT